MNPGRNKVSRRSQRDIVEEKIQFIQDKHSEIRKQVKLDKDSGYILIEPEVDWPEDSDDEIVLPVIVPKVGDRMPANSRLRTSGSTKAAISCAEDNNDAEELKKVPDSELEQRALEQYRFGEAVLVEVEIVVKRVYRAYDLKEISQTSSPDEPILPNSDDFVGVV